MALLPGDFYGESVALGDPTHLVFANERSYVAEIQTPPYHVDYVQAPFEVNGVRPERKSVMNLSWMSSSVAYSQSQTENKKVARFKFRRFVICIFKFRLTLLR